METTQEIKIESKIEINMPNVEHKQQDEIVELLTKEKEKPTFKLYEKVVIGFSVVQAVESFMLIGGTVLANFTDVLSAPVKEVVKQSPYVLMTLSALNLALVAGLFGGFKYKERKDHIEDERVEKEIEALKEKHKPLQEEVSPQDQALFDELEKMKEEYDVDEESNSVVIKMQFWVKHKDYLKKQKKQDALGMEMDEIEPQLKETKLIDRNPLSRIKTVQPTISYPTDTIADGKKEEEEPLLRSPGK